MKKNYDYITLLTRDEFRNLCFERANGMCCIPGCNCKGDDAHHIMDRKLWSDGGYYLSNAASVCNKHHIDCETGVYTPYQVMQFAGIDIKYLKKPQSLDWLSDEDYKEMFINGEINKFGEGIWYE